VLIVYSNFTDMNTCEGSVLLATMNNMKIQTNFSRMPNLKLPVVVCINRPRNVAILYKPGFLLWHYINNGFIQCLTLFVVLIERNEVCVKGILCLRPTHEDESRPS
jgi:hypothetical protein